MAYLRYVVLMSVTMKITAFWNVMPCSLMGSYIKIVLEEHAPSVIMVGE
jgi:hypothetical protein